MSIDRNGQDPDSYQGVNPVNRPKTVIAQRAPGTLDRRYNIGTPWINRAAGSVYFLTTVTNGAANWAISTPGASDVDTLTGDTGGALSPTAGNMNILGGTNMAVAGAGSTLTLNVDAASTFATSVTSPSVVATTSVTSPIYTTAAAADTNINSAAGQDIILQMGDAAAANKVSFEDVASVEVASLDSDGTLTVVNMDGIIGATTPAAGTFTTVVASTSVSSPIFTSAAADTNINAAANQDLILQMGDAAGAQKISFEDSASAEVANLDSAVELNLLAGDCVVSRSAASADVTAQVTNSDNTAADSDAFVEVAVGGTSGGNAGIRFQISGGQNYSMGIDNADSDKLVVCADNDLGTDVLMKMDETTKDVEVAQGNLVIGAVAKQLQMEGVQQLTSSDKSLWFQEQRLLQTPILLLMIAYS